MSKPLFPTRRVLWLPLDYTWQPSTPEMQHCCREMAAALEFDCADHADPFDCPDTVIVFHEIFGEYGLPIRDGGPSYLVISHCPFCGGGSTMLHLRAFRCVTVPAPGVGVSSDGQEDVLCGSSRLRFH